MVDVEGLDGGLRVLEKGLEAAQAALHQPGIVVGDACRNTKVRNQITTIKKKKILRERSTGTMLESMRALRCWSVPLAIEPRV